MLILELRLYPAHHSEEPSFGKKLARWLPIVVLPLLIVFSVCIKTYFTDDDEIVFGIYLLLFNIWCYAICIILILNRYQRIIWLPLSLVLAFAAVSALPLNVSSCVKAWMHQSIASQIAASGIDKLPMDEAAFCDWITKMEPSQRDMIDNRLYGMRRMFGPKSYKDLILDEHYGLDSSDCYRKSQFSSIDTTDDDKTVIERDPVPYNYRSANIIKGEMIPTGGPFEYESMVLLNNYETTQAIVDAETGRITFTVQPYGPSRFYTFYIDRNQIEEFKVITHEPGILHADDADLYLTYFGFNYMPRGEYRRDPETHLKLSGVMMIKQQPVDPPSDNDQEDQPNDSVQ